MSGVTVFTPLADTFPQPEAGSAQVGIMPTASRADHEHPRLSSANSGALNASGEATITFTRTFATMPSMVFTYIEAADGQPVVMKVKFWVQDGSNNYTGCVVKGYRSQTIPTNLVTLLLGGVFNLFNGSASGVSFTCIALQTSS